MKKLIIVTTLFLSLPAFALEIDETLTTRIMEVSATKKTILLNRGIEDGLVVGDHVKLFLTQGVIGRAVAVKASPQRSIWSVYRIVSPDKIVMDKVVKIKATPPINISDDQSRVIYPPQAHPNINALDINNGLSAEEKEEIESLGLSPEPHHDGIPKDRSFESWGMIHLNNFSSRTTRRESSTLSDFNISLGVEKYFDNGKKNPLKDISFSLFYHHAKNQTIALNGDSTGNLAHEFGAGISWHFLNPALSYQRPIAFVQGTYGVGIVEDFVQAYGDETTVTEGSDNFFSFGLGLKYYAWKGWGVRILGDYYYRDEHYSIKNGGPSENKQLQGLRFMIGLAWRFQ